MERPLSGLPGRSTLPRKRSLSTVAYTAADRVPHASAAPNRMTSTALNYCGAGEEFIEYSVDCSSYIQDRYLQGARIPIYSPDGIAQTMPDYVQILPWIRKEEVVEQMTYIKKWGG